MIEPSNDKSPSTLRSKSSIYQRNGSISFATTRLYHQKVSKILLHLLTLCNSKETSITVYTYPTTSKAQEEETQERQQGRL